MDLLKLNRLAALYRRTQDQVVFSEIYEELRDQRLKNERVVKRSGYGDADDALGVFHEAIMRVLRSDFDDFGKSLAVSLRNARIDFFRKTRRERERYPMQDDYKDEEGAAIPAIELVGTEATIVEDAVHKKKEADKRELTDFLLESAKILKDHSVTTAIVKEFRSPQFESVNAIGKSLGIHHEVVKRKVKRLSRFTTLIVSVTFASTLSFNGV
jgi:DNA-directed RNA polymerase specialized sigma24 family protein